MFYSTNQSHHWKLNQSEVAIYGRLSNQKPGKRTNQKRGVFLYVHVRTIYTVTESSLAFCLLTDHDDVHLREMRQKIDREEQPDQTSKDSCSFLTDLFLWGMRQGVQSTRPQKEAWSVPQLQLDLRSMWSVLQQTGHPSTPSCQHERPEAKQRLPIKRPAAPEPGPIPKQRRTVLPPRTPMGNPVGPDVLRKDPETRA